MLEFERAPDDTQPPAGQVFLDPRDLDYYRGEVLRAHRTIGALQQQLEQAQADLETERAARPQQQRAATVQAWTEDSLRLLTALVHQAGGVTVTHDELEAAGRRRISVTTAHDGDALRYVVT